MWPQCGPQNADYYTVLPIKGIEPRWTGKDRALGWYIYVSFALRCGTGPRKLIFLGPVPVDMGDFAKFLTIGIFTLRFFVNS